MQKNDRPLIPALAYPNKLINQLCMQSSLQLAVLKEIKTVLPEPIQAHALHCVTGVKTLTVFTDSANWATQLRFYSNAMLAVANAATTGKLTSLRVKILPTHESRKQMRKPLIPTQATIDVLQSHSDTIPDLQLKASLMRLSSTLLRLQKDNA